MLSAPCGADCNVCEFKEDCGGSCFACEGKPCYIATTGLEICEIYDCAINKKGYKSCGECADLPCEIFYAWKDPSISDEDFKANVDMRVAALRAENE
jgi:hypothetical protein